MENLLKFFSAYGLPLTIIAVVGIIILGVMKYGKLFAKIDEDKRHYIYLFISVGFSVVATVVYLAIVGQLSAEYVLSLATAIYVLNQTFYNIFKITPINKLARKALDYIFKRIKEKPPDTTPDDTV